MSSQRSATSDHVQIIPFCAPLPSQNGNASPSSDETFGVVGTITLRGPSAVVWFGWGDIESADDEEPTAKQRDLDECVSVGNGELMMDFDWIVQSFVVSLFLSLIDGTSNEYVISSFPATGNPPMGSLSLSMPPSKQSSVHNDVPSTQLIGGSSEEDMILGQQISARLAKRVGWPIFVSCSFHGWGDDSGSGEAFCLGMDVSPQLAAAVAEKEVARILIREKERIADCAR
ncbi:hypothetical protein HJC23_006882 [Cyclotella cryptica]|uniref:Proteasome assembly chaperone 2 n=1 Tax=Cyclotella cryptica TaxID=29204 RepID=A0ABD3QBV5_9STRA